MSQDNQITLRGYLTAEPRFRETTKTRTPMSEIRVGSTPRRLNRETGEWQESQTSYYTVKCWRRLAINTASCLHKGDMVVIRGRFYMNTWVDAQQQPRAALEIEADSIGHDLAYGWTHYNRGVRDQGTGQGVGQGGGDGGESRRQETGQPAEAGNGYETEENDDYLAPGVVDRGLDDNESAERDPEPDSEPDSEAAGSDLGVSGAEPEAGPDGDAERLDTMMLAV
jgi:single-strand DNA-binding protein